MYGRGNLLAALHKFKRKQVGQEATLRLHATFPRRNDYGMLPEQKQGVLQVGRFSFPIWPFRGGGPPPLASECSQRIGESRK
jgi:hypothetical protein